MEKSEIAEKIISSLSCEALFLQAPEVTVFLPPRAWRSDRMKASKRLLIAARSRGWFIASRYQMELFNWLKVPRTRRDLYEKYGNEGIKWIAELWRRGIVSLNGRVQPECTSSISASRQLSFIALHMSQSCNLRCSYCYNESKGGAILAPERAIALFEKICRESECLEFNVDFLGGEPLLAFDEIVAIMDKTRELEKIYKRKFNFLMQTNGLLLDVDKIKTLKRYGVGVGVSLDGPPDIHDKYRCAVNGRKTQAEVVENVKKARQFGLDVNPLAVISEPSRYVEILEYFVNDLGVRTMRFNNLVRIGRARHSEKIAQTNYLDYSRGFLNMVDRAVTLASQLGTKLRIYDLYWYLHDLTSSERPYMCRQSPCGIGECIVSYGPDGYVYACEEYEQTTRKSMVLGTLDEVNFGDIKGTSRFWREYRARRIEDIPRCSRCPLRLFCGGGCAHKALAQFGNWYREDPFCSFYERIFPALMWKIGEDPRVLQYLL